MAIVYKHIKKSDNTVFYVGIGKDLSRAYCKRGRNPYWMNIANKYEYYVEIVFDNLTWEQAKSAEKWLIDIYGRIGNRNGWLVNMTDGGDGMLGLTHSEESRKKMSISRSGENNPNWGRKFPEEYGKRISDRMKGKKRSEESRLKQAQTIKGRKRPDHAERMKGGSAPSAKKVTDGVTVWDCIKDAANDLNVPYTTLAGQLNPNDKRKNLLGLKYVSNEH